MNYFVRRPWDLPESMLSDESVYSDRAGRREFLKSLGIHTASAGLSMSLLTGCSSPTIEELEAAGGVDAETGDVAATRNEAFTYGRDETPRREVLQFANFYEFTTSKQVYLSVDQFEPVPWEFSVAGLCKKPRTFDLDDLARTFTFEERAYRHRCVETWAMCVPWTGFPLAELLKLVEPESTAKYVKFDTFLRPEQAPMQQYPSYPWPYSEGLTIDEALNPLTLIATGLYGQPLAKQNGAPVRLVVPWKYGFKSIKSITRIELTDQPPATFWNTVNPHEYGFEANVDPNVPHPRWSQSTEWMLGTRERFETQKYNGYGEYVAKLYAG